MHDGVRRKLEMMSRVRDFGKIHASSLPSTSAGVRLFAALGEIVAKLEQSAVAQASSRTSGRNITISKAAARAALVDDLDAISLCAKAVAITTPGLENKFRTPREASDHALLATARAFASDALLLKDKFIAMDMPANFLDVLAADIAEFDAALSQRRNTRGSLRNATASIENALGEGIKIVQQLKAAMHFNLADNDALMTEWLSASRTERAPRRPPASETQPAANSGPAAGPSAETAAAGSKTKAKGKKSARTKASKA